MLEHGVCCGWTRLKKRSICDLVGPQMIADTQRNEESEGLEIVTTEDLSIGVA